MSVPQAYIPDTKEMQEQLLNETLAGLLGEKTVWTHSKPNGLKTECETNKEALALLNLHGGTVRPSYVPHYCSHNSELEEGMFRAFDDENLIKFLEYVFDRVGQEASKIDHAMTVFSWLGIRKSDKVRYLIDFLKEQQSCTTPPSPSPTTTSSPD